MVTRSGKLLLYASGATIVYQPKPLPALDLEEERQVSDELRSISRELEALHRRVGSGGYSVDYPSGVFMTLDADGAWHTVATDQAVAMPGNSNVTVGTDGSLEIAAVSSINHVSVHANIYMDSGDANLTDAIKMHISRVQVGQTQEVIGGLTRTQWATSAPALGFFANLGCSVVVGGAESSGSKFFVQLSQTGSAAIEVRIRSVQFSLEFS